MREAYLREVVDTDDEDLPLITGRFTVVLQDDGRPGDEVEHPDLRSALAVARASADRVFVDVEDRRYVAAGPADGLPVLDGPALDRASRARRPSGLEWLDRRPTDPPVPYVLRVELFPDDRSRAAQRRVVRAVADALAAAGVREVATAEDELDAALEDIGSQVGAGGGGWMTAHTPAHVVAGVLDAATHRVAARRGRVVAGDAVAAATGAAPWGPGARDLRGWGVTAAAWPAGAAEPHGDR